MLEISSWQVVVSPTEGKTSYWFTVCLFLHSLLFFSWFFRRKKRAAGVLVQAGMSRSAWRSPGFCTNPFRHCGPDSKVCDDEVLGDLSWMIMYSQQTLWESNKLKFTLKNFSSLFFCVFFSKCSKVFSILLFSFLRLLRLFPQVRVRQVSLALFFFLPPLMWFSHPAAKSVEPQLSDHSPISHRSQPTSFSCYCGQSSSLVLPATAPFPVLEGKTESDRGMERNEIWWKERKKSREGAHMSEWLRDARRSRESSQLMFIKQMEWVCERVEGREGDWE